MAKTNSKRKDAVASVKRRLVAAICMLLISSLMLVSTSYAWLTLSAAPEARGIDTSIAGNGSLEIALVPADGDVAKISSGRGGADTYFGNGATTLTVNANTFWGNIVNLNDASYGIGSVTLAPARMNVAGGVVDAAKPFSVPTYAYDGRIKEAKDARLVSYDPENAENPLAGTGDLGTGGNKRGVRIICDDSNNTFGYVVDLAFRLNTVAASDTNGKLILQAEAVDRAGLGAGSVTTQGHGSTLSFQKTTTEGEGDSATTTVTDADPTSADVIAYYGAIRIAFVSNLGKAALETGEQTEVLAYARADSTGSLYVCDASGNAVDGNVIIDSMEKDKVYQISAVVWIDGTNVTNANVAVNNEVLNQATLNLQFATDVRLTPGTAVNTIPQS